MIENYINRHSIQGMMSKRYKIYQNYDGIIKNSKTIILFDSNLTNKNFEKIQYNYMLQQINKKLSYKLTGIMSMLDSDFFKLYGNKFKEIRETKNHYNKKIKITEKINNKNELFEMLNYWKNNIGTKYGWTNHTGYDINFFENYYDVEKNDLQTLFFYDNDKIIGYSAISLLNDDSYKYIIRKSLSDQYRNLSLYIDFKSFEYMYNNIKKDLIIHWGASSGNVLKYKSKFPIYKTFPVYFYKEENNANTL